jgi:NADH:ubiquinone oxidoreductase subunit E
MHPKTLDHKSPDPNVANIIEGIGRSRAGIVQTLRTLHTQYGRLTPRLISEVARKLKSPESQVHGIATF